MPREYKAYLKDILESIRRIEKYSENLTYESFQEDELIQDGVVRNILLLMKPLNIPPEVRSQKIEE